MDNGKDGDLAEVMGRIPSGMFVLTCGDGKGNRTGMLASWVQQAAFEPPMISFAVESGRFINDWLTQTGVAAVNLVGESQKNLLRHFGRGFEPDQPAFEGLQTITGKTGVPLLADSLGYLEGELAGCLEAGGHHLHLLKIVAGGCGPRWENEAPMVHIRKNGFRY